MKNYLVPAIKIRYKNNLQIGYFKETPKTNQIGGKRWIRNIYSVQIKNASIFK